MKMILRKHIRLLLLAMSWLLLQGASLSLPVVAQSAELSREELIRLGERMYREGILPSGEVMKAYIRGDIEVDSTAFSCSSCHLRAGLGSVEGGVVTPPTNGLKLYKPYQRPPSLDDIPDKAGRYIYAKTVTQRPAYTRESLAKALRFGTDPAGQIFNDVMPRYPLDDRDMSIMISYLETLSSDQSPGASNKELRFATIITDDVSQEDRQSLLSSVQGFINQKNQQMAMYNDFVKFGYTPTADMKYAFRQASLDVWELKGAAETWRTQLKAFYAKKPVFAVLGGISNSDWQPIHDFCEDERLPCLFPVTGFPVITKTGWYTYYFNKGYAQEGEAVASYLNRLDKQPVESSILQIVQDSATGSALASGFQQKWAELERRQVTTFKLTAKQLRDRSTLAKLIEEHNPSVLLLWADFEVMQALSPLLTQMRAPEMVFVSSGYLGGNSVAIPEVVRDKVYLTFPYRLTPYVGPKTGGFDSRIPFKTSAKDLGDKRVASRTIDVLQQSIQRSLSLLYDNLYRDNLLDIMSMQMDLIVRDYERLSFGPGQRYVSKGCYIIQLGAGPDPQLIPKSDWVIH